MRRSCCDGSLGPCRVLEAGTFFGKHALSAGWRCWGHTTGAPSTLAPKYLAGPFPEAAERGVRRDPALAPHRENCGSCLHILGRRWTSPPRASRYKAAKCGQLKMAEGLSRSLGRVPGRPDNRAAETIGRTRPFSDTRCQWSVGTKRALGSWPGDLPARASPASLAIAQVTGPANAFLGSGGVCARNRGEPPACASPWGVLADKMRALELARIAPGLPARMACAARRLKGPSSCRSTSNRRVLSQARRRRPLCTCCPVL
jgi:hypothetical protein